VKCDAWTDAWSGGQFSLVRICLGCYLLVHFLHLLPWAGEVFSAVGVFPGAASPLFALLPSPLWIADHPLVAQLLIGAGACSALAIVLGRWQRAACILAWYVLACLHARNPLIGNPSLPYIGWLLLWCACLPAAPFGSWDARGRTDPDGGWRMPRGFAAAAWWVLAIGYSYSGLAKLGSVSWMDGSAFSQLLGNPLARPGALRDVLLQSPAWLLGAASWGALALEIGYAPLSLWRRLRPWLWCAMLAMHLALIGLIDFADLSLGMVILHLATFDPRWLPARETRLLVAYDGHCGLCHGFVRFVLAEDRSGICRLTALDSPAQRAAMPEHIGESRSLLVRRGNGAVFRQSDAVIIVLDALGGFWRVCACLLRAIPRPLRDGGYQAIAALRYRIAGRRAQACPLMPPELRARFAVSPDDLALVPATPSVAAP